MSESGLPAKSNARPFLQEKPTRDPGWITPELKPSTTTDEGRSQERRMRTACAQFVPLSRSPPPHGSPVADRQGVSPKLLPSPVSLRLVGLGCGSQTFFDGKIGWKIRAATATVSWSVATAGAVKSLKQAGDRHRLRPGTGAGRRAAFVCPRSTDPKLLRKNLPRLFVRSQPGAD